MVTMRLLSISKKSDSTRSFSSGASICKKDTAPYLSPVLNVPFSLNSKEDGAIKSFVLSPEGASHFHSKAKGSLPFILRILCMSFNRSLPSREESCTPSRLKAFQRSFSMRSRRGFAILILSASMPKVRYFVFTSPLLPLES